MGRYTSNVLYHFVGRSHPDDNEANYEILKKVLLSKCISHPPHNDDWGMVSTRIDLDKSLLTEDLIISTMVCFCDIPEEHLDIHIQKYGSFGLSIGKDYFIRYGGRPVMYVPLHREDWGAVFGGQTWIRDVDEAYRGFRKEIFEKLTIPKSRRLCSLPTSPAESAMAINNVLVLNFLAFLKPFKSELDEKHPENYYMEREWRKHGNLKFNPSEVQQILVAHGFAERIEKDFPEYKRKTKEIPLK